MKQIKAFQVTATVEGKTWLSRATVLTADNETAAADKAKKILNLTPEHNINIEPVTVYESGAKLETNDYPYGRLRCTAFFSAEYDKKKGMRSVFQTINPKNGRLNAPKKSTYCRVLLPMQEANGHYSFCGWLDFNGTESINKGLYFMADFYELFTPEQIKDIALTIIAMSQINTKAIVIYSGADFEALKPLIETQIKNLAKIANTGENLFLDSLFDLAAIEATKKPDYNPFTVSKSY